jgi:hypothetical protein
MTVALQTLDPVHHKGFRLALGIFAICKMENALCEAGVPTLSEMKELNTANVGIKILTKVRHFLRHEDL